MSGFSLFFLLAIAMVFIGEINAQRCPPNEVWNSCGTRCPLTCREPGPRPCTRECVPGCFCRHRWLRNHRGICVARC
ncbi:chymotrypsin-elastase inhibitor ixodidin [Diachasma alloeum]|uniref:chymotrypsin-elastase inhibitor ixodidin n=1 Tax=Diachasma alloeum TaxID=454923 RepID=UPI0007385187|nr:chymotrypsin-elastase inhibitor ixodidin [Diachasma alloeum]